MKTPSGLLAIALLVTIGAILGILEGVLGLIGALAEGAPLWGTYSGILLAVSIIELVVGFGLWTLKGWAWTAAIVVVILRVIAGVVSLALSITISPLVALVVHAIVLWYLFRPNVKGAFGK